MPLPTNNPVGSIEQAPPKETALRVALSILRCPVDQGVVRETTVGDLQCMTCGRHFPIVNGCAVLLDEDRSLFQTATVIERRHKAFIIQSGWKYRVKRLLPASAHRAAPPLKDRIPRLPEKARVFVAGSGRSKERLSQSFPGSCEFLFSDVTLQGDADLVCDLQALPLQDGCLDCVIVDNVLEHVADPRTAVQEIERCLKVGGIVYSCIPFFFPRHGPMPYDFQRFTPGGHRFLFGGFDTVSLACTGGPIGMLSLAAIAALQAMNPSSRGWSLASSLAVRVCTRPLLWIDRWVSSSWQRGATSIPGGSVFVGRRRENQTPPRQLLAEVIAWQPIRP